MSTADFEALRRRIFGRILATAVPSAAVAAYIFGLVIGLEEGALFKALAGFLLPILVLSALQQYTVTSRLLRRALAQVPGEPEGARLIRILELPRRVEVFSNVLAWVIGSVAFGALAAIFYGKGLQVVVAATGIGLFSSLFPGLMLVMLIEEDVRQIAVEEFQRNPRLALPPRGFFWPRQSWYLPYAFGIALVSMVVFSGMVIVAKYDSAVATLLGAIQQQGYGEAVATVQAQLSALALDAVLPVVGIAFVLLIAFGITGILLARRQARAASAVEESLRSMAAGNPQLPAWIATDEIGDLSAATAVISLEMRHVFEQLRAMAAGDLGSELRGDSGLIQVFRESRAGMLELAQRMVALSRGESIDAVRISGDLGGAFDRLQSSFQAIVDAGPDHREGGPAARRRRPRRARQRHAADDRQPPRHGGADAGGLREHRRHRREPPVRCGAALDRHHRAGGRGDRDRQHDDRDGADLRGLGRPRLRADQAG